MIRRLPLLPTVLVAAAVATMIGLGIWQLQRAAWKEGLLATYRTAQGQPGIAFPTFPTKNEPPYFRKATGHELPADYRTLTNAPRDGEWLPEHLAAQVGNPEVH